MYWIFLGRQLIITRGEQKLLVTVITFGCEGKLSKMKRLIFFKRGQRWESVFVASAQSHGTGWADLTCKKKSQMALRSVCQLCQNFFFVFLLLLLESNLLEGNVCCLQHQSAMYEKSLKSNWSASVKFRASRGGVRIGFSVVNSSSKFDTSSFPFWKIDRRRLKTWATFCLKT